MGISVTGIVTIGFSKQPSIYCVNVRFMGYKDCYNECHEGGARYGKEKRT